MPRMDSKGLMSSNSDSWETPQDFFDKLNAEFKFNLDVCATNANTKCRLYYDQDMDGLAQTWKGNVWMNPPYGRGVIKKWMAKALHEVEAGHAKIVVCLVPARTDTAWWHDYAVKGEIRFLRGRLRFSNAKQFAPFPSAVVIFRSL